jgi:primosomal protein N' (replication factor Y)
MADVAVRVNIPDADPVFTYRAPPRLRAVVRPGRLVWVPLRRKRVQGIILDTYTLEPQRQNSTLPIRDIDDLADPEAVLTEAQIRLARWVAAYYRVPLYEALALMLPPGVSQEAEPTWRASETGMSSDLGGLPEAERAVLYYLRQHGQMSERDLRQALRGSDSELRELYTALHERGLITRGTTTSRAKARPRIERLARLMVIGEALEQEMAALERAPKQRAVLSFLRDNALVAGSDSQQPTTDNHTPALDQRIAVAETRASTLASAALAYPVTPIYAATGTSVATLRALEQRGLIELTQREVRRDPLSGDDVPPDVPPALTSAQERAWRPISAALDHLDKEGARKEGPGQEPHSSSASILPSSSAEKTFLLHGVTGSGKTEIYLRAIARTMRRGRQALVLVPEIALTAQLVRRFAARFPGQLAVLHSGLGLGERYDEWRRLRRGEAMLAIGSRSAVFAPMPQLGLIILDEEHEPTFKHDGSPRYHARDAARRLSELTGSVLILGSATPSVESYQAAQDGTYQLISLAERVGMRRDARGLPRSEALPLPPVQIVDMRRELQTGNRSIFSRPLQRELERTLLRGQQAILFLNRRGAASFIMCRDCGFVIPCPNCSSPLTVHYGDEDRPAVHDERPMSSTIEPPSSALRPSSLLICHSCNHREFVPLHCPQCWSQRIKSFGIGTQRVVEEVEAMFPGARTLRWDKDTVGRKGDHERMLDTFLDHKADVLVGTQMIAKGLDLPLVSMVGVVAADTGLHLPDFRAGERAFQLLTQVAGRAGRRIADAHVIIQTYSPDHYALRAAQEHDYEAFFTQEIAFREQTGYPPFSRLVRFVYSSGSDDRNRKAAEALAAEISQLATALNLPQWSIIGPAPAFFHRQRNRFRWHIVLRALDPSPLLAVLRLPHGWTLDVDPIHVL